MLTPTWVVPAVTAAAIVIVAAVAFLNSTFTMHGTITNPCYGNPNVGDEVTIYNNTGTIIGYSTLGARDYVGTNCAYPFTVENVPNFESVYSIQIGRLVNRVNFSRDQAEYPQMTVTKFTQ